MKKNNQVRLQQQESDEDECDFGDTDECIIDKPAPIE